MPVCDVAEEQTVFRGQENMLWEPETVIRWADRHLYMALP